MNTKIIKIIVFSCIGLLLLSCSGNAIYCDIENQTINRCSGTVFNRLEISTDSLQLVTFIKKKENKKGVSRLNINNIDSDYIIEEVFGRGILKSFTLLPNREYLLLHSSIGDAATAELTIRTDSVSRIVYASKTSCR
ncbi:hypothetical protein M2132_002227 [Dysgonomonas sp. PH5-45]|uniref:hypothetical protein n=1 Tax=unclassified Dysgonomonas TaxID=2630389 RepID=UPI002476B2FA|nr:MULTISPECIES: hypothetical protein [unclassified Dysgonomonas]MDH6355877.1 hypothetical protein [Dysgonomonas sp. PH5-45]MDH6388772.1 hypothetical protein [Dysgonomonas sp. PH5-37]